MSRAPTFPEIPTVPGPLLAGLRSHREEVYRRGFVETRSGKRSPATPTGMSAAAGEELREIVGAYRAERTIETGLAFALSTLFILDGVLGAGVKAREGMHTAIDPFQRSNWGESGLVTLERAGVRGLVRHIEEDSALALPGLVRGGERFDLAFVDGGHLFENAFLDLYFFTRLVRAGGVIVVDDVWMPAVRAAIDFAESNLGLSARVSSPREGRARFAVLTLPSKPPERAWDHFVAFSERWPRTNS
jgi:predicted O-methyltransferase YrrM